MFKTTGSEFISSGVLKFNVFIFRTAKAPGYKVTGFSKYGVYCI
jgi:hypothetical protein